MVVSGMKRESAVSARRSMSGRMESGVRVGGGGKWSFERRAARALRSCSVGKGGVSMVSIWAFFKK